LISFMQREPTHVPQGLNLLSIVRNLERIADHATNIAEDVLFYVKGIDVRAASRTGVSCRSAGARAAAG
jgi:phosphate transport system protein